MRRRQFLQQTSSFATLVAVLPTSYLFRPDITKITILHTNDWHSRIDPFPNDGGRNSGLGGVAKRAHMIEQIREEEDHVLLLDSGDIFQGTPYFNFFAGEIEMKLMSAMKYDASTIGNHDFDAGLDGLEKQLHNAKFPFINCNYDFSDTVLDGRIRPYQVFEKGSVRIGVMGLGIELQGLVPEKLYGGTRYLDPIENANEMAKFLKAEEQCDYVICLSHLGFRYRDGQVDDIKLAKSTSYIDLILGGHTHTFMSEPLGVLNSNGKAVLINQVGWAGILLGKIDIYFEKNRLNRCTTCDNRPIS